MTTKRTLVILDKSIQLDDYESLLSDNNKIIVLDFETHKKLEKKNILHELLDDYLENNERQKLYDLTLSKYRWYDNLSKKINYEVDNINILSLMSPLEFHEFLLSILIKFSSIKNVLSKNNPDEIFISKKLYQNLSSQCKINST